MSIIGPVRDGPFKRWLNHQVTTSCFQVFKILVSFLRGKFYPLLYVQVLGGAISAVITYHGVENRPKGGICVANHTSPIDVLCLACDNAYALMSRDIVFSITNNIYFNIIVNFRLDRNMEAFWDSFKPPYPKHLLRFGLREESPRIGPRCLEGFRSMSQTQRNSPS